MGQTESEHKKAIDPSGIRGELLDEFKKKLVGVLVAIPSFLVAIPYISEAFAAGFGLHPALAFRIFSNFYFTLPIFLIVWWYVDLLKQEQLAASEWHAQRLPVLLAASIFYLAIIIVLPILFSPAGVTSQTFSGVGLNEDWEVVVPVFLLTLAGGTGYLLWTCIGRRTRPNPAEFVLHVPILTLVALFYTIILVYTLPWQDWAYTVACCFFIAALGFLTFVSYRFNKPSRENQKSNKRHALFIYSGALMLLSLWMVPTHDFSPGKFRSADATVFDDTSRKSPSTAASVSDDFYRRFEKDSVVEVLKDAEIRIKDSLRATDLALRQSLPANVDFYIKHISQNTDSTPSEWKGYNAHLNNRNSLTEAQAFITALKGSLATDEEDLLPVLRVAQWRGLFFLGIILISLLYFHYECRRYKYSDSAGVKNLDYRIAVSDSWFVILVLLTLPLLMPADNVPAGPYGSLRLPQWFLPNVDELPYKTGATHSETGIMDTLHVVFPTDYKSFPDSALLHQILNKITTIDNHERHYQTPIIKAIANIIVPNTEKNPANNKTGQDMKQALQKRIGLANPDNIQTQYE